MLVLAHRGASRAAPENAPEAFRLADAMGADGVELDVRLLGDRRLVVHHDPLPSTVDGSGLVDLDVALDACGSRMLVNLEVKNLETEPDFDPTMRVVDLVAEELDRRGSGDADRWLVSSFSWATLEHCRRVAPQVRTAWLVADTTDEVVRLAADAGDVALHPWVGTVTPDSVARCHDAGLAVHAWTCNDAERLVELLAAGTDGVCTDVPDTALAAVGRSPGRQGGAVTPRWGRPA